MPHTYKQVPQQKAWALDAMEKPIIAVRNEEMSFFKAKEFKVPRSTLM